MTFFVISETVWRERVIIRNNLHHPLLSYLFAHFKIHPNVDKRFCLQTQAYKLNLESARIARRAADDVTQETGKI